MLMTHYSRWDNIRCWLSRLLISDHWMLLRRHQMICTAVLQHRHRISMALSLKWSLMKVGSVYVTHFVVLIQGLPGWVSTWFADWLTNTAQDVQNRFRFGFKKKTRIQFGMSSVRFGSVKKMNPNWISVIRTSLTITAVISRRGFMV